MHHYRPLFVTWHTVGSGEPRLRGCIGTFSPEPLPQGLADYALTSALRDSRFRPVQANELPRLDCAVSLLVNFESGAHYLDWEVGVHGIRIEFVNDKGVRRSATYLPEVARDQGWSKVEAIDSLFAKAGVRGTVTEAMRQGLALTRYQSIKIHTTYAEWLAAHPTAPVGSAGPAGPAGSPGPARS